MNLQFSDSELSPLVNAIVRQTIEQLSSEGLLENDSRLAVLESTAASLIDTKPHTLRDARLRGEITPTKIGGRIGYEISELRAYLARNRQET